MSIDVAIVMGSASDWDVMSNAQKMLDQFGVKAESRVLSAHRTPKELEEFIRECEEQKVKAFIAGAGLAAALPGVVAALTRRFGRHRMPARTAHQAAHSAQNTAPVPARVNALQG